ncbi:hypothetical protein [Hymenobacter guriensis]|uniref:Recombination associated protein RdgC n=1 Tax=Hymenobacter guriensis TaxID=2793065 RepID=A0ABS0KZG2_9BACT|nr:hypothetical protein [Hymenobacter guriensis]MBG8553095.1 hypothetical protein [Hymenobacter guriensis]
MSTELTQEDLEKILPEDIARTFESAYHVFQGNTEHVEDLLKHGAVLLRKASQRFSSTQVILGVAVLAIGAVLLTKRAADAIQEHSDQEHSEA